MCGSRGRWGKGERDWTHPGPDQLEMSLPPLVLVAQAPGGSGEGKKEGMHRFLRRRSEEQGMKAWFLRALLQLRNPHPRVGSAEGGANSGPRREGRAARSKAILVTAPPGAGLSGFLFGEKTQQNPTRRKGWRKEWAWPGLCGSRVAGWPYPGPILMPLPGPCPPPAFGERAGPAGCARPLICRAGGGRAGWGLFVTLLPRSPRSPGSGLRRSLPLAAAASAGAICCCRFWRSAIQKQTSSMTTNSYSQMY